MLTYIFSFQNLLLKLHFQPTQAMPMPMECDKFCDRRELCSRAGICLSPRTDDNAELLKKADQQKISLAVSEQVSLVGSQSLYEKINKNFKEYGFDAIFAKVKLKNSFFLFYVSRWSIFRILGSGLGVGNDE